MLVRCVLHSPPNGKHSAQSVEPVGYPDTSAVCGRCDNIGMAWLSREEAGWYSEGVRVFQINNASVRVRVRDPYGPN